MKRKRGRPRKIIRTEPVRIGRREPILIAPLQPLRKDDTTPQKEQLITSPYKVTSTANVEILNHKEKDEDDTINDETKTIKRDRGSHNAEEKRRKEKINLWIQRLGDLVCKLPAQRKSKNAILENAFHYIKNKKKTETEQDISIRIKHLESLIILLSDLLKKHSIKIPECIQLKTYSPLQNVNTELTVSPVKGNSVNTDLTVSPVIPKAPDSSSINTEFTVIPVKSQLNLCKIPSVNVPLTDTSTVPHPQMFILQSVDMACQMEPLAHHTIQQNISRSSSETVAQSLQSTQQKTPPKVVSSQEIRTSTETTASNISANNHKERSKGKNTYRAKKNLNDGLQVLRSLSLDSGERVQATSITLDNTKVVTDLLRPIVTDLWRPIESLLSPLALNEIRHTSAVLPTTNKVIHVLSPSTNHVEQNKNMQRITCMVPENIPSTDAITSEISVPPTSTTCVMVPGNTTKSTESAVTLMTVSSPCFYTSPKAGVRRNLVSPIQSFGIDSILISNSIPPADAVPTALHTDNSSKVSATKPNIALSTESFNPVSLSTPNEIKCSTVQRSRISSSGHTVAALLDAAHGCEIQVNKSNQPSKTIQSKCHISCSNASKTARISSENILQESKSFISTRSSRRAAQARSSSMLNPLTSSVNSTIQHDTLTTSSSSVSTSTTPVSSNPNTSKRWGNVLVNAHNNNMLLTSFVLGSKASHKNKTKLNKLIKRKSKKREALTIHGKNSNMLIDDTCLSEQMPKVTNPCSYSPKDAAKRSSESNVTSDSNKTLCVATLQNIQAVCSSNVWSNSPCISSVVSTTVGVTNRHIISRNKQNSSAQPVNIESKTTANATISTNVVTLCSQVISSSSVQYEHIGKTTSQAKTISEQPSSTLLPAISPVRTMRDRTVKNKWLEMEKNNQEISSVSVTTDVVHEQCASPVISYENISKRKRTNDGNVSNQPESKRALKSEPSNKISQNIDFSKNKNSSKDHLTSSTPFSAESLCKPDRRKNAEKRNLKNEIKVNKKPGTRNKSTNNHQQQQQIKPQTQQPSQRPAPKLNHQPNLTYPTTLPTILNIFAPAPVPTSNMQHTNMQAGLSNFSTETLLSNNCHMNMMGSNMGDQNFADNMLMSANFTNFSADTLISENDSNMTYAVDNLLSQNNQNHIVANYWNQSWLPHDMTYNESLFQMSNLQNNPQRNRQHVSTECSPIKSIMSILQSPPNNNLPHLENLSPNQGLQNNTLMQNRFNQRQKKTNDQIGNNFLTNPQNVWNKPISQNNFPKVNNFQNNSQLLSFNFQGNQANNITSKNAIPSVPVGTPRNLLPNSHMSGDVGYINSQFHHNSKLDIRPVKNKHGPSFGNYSLVNSS